jgi:aminoglycoside 6'-N-acetyltransferase I
MHVTDLAAAAADQRAQAAHMLHREFNQPRWHHSWPTLKEAEDEVERLCRPEHIARAAVNAAGRVLGWVGGLPEYDGNVWELHPLIVDAAMRGQGIGRALVLDFEAQVAARGGLTITLGTDDTDNMTSLGGVDLYQNLWEKIARIENHKQHPYGFYLRLGYIITGVVPDANGRGQPDIYMSKRVSGTPPEIARR